MSNLSDLVDYIHRYNERLRITESSTQAEKLRHRIMYENLSKQEYIVLRQEVRDFIKSDASEQDKQMIIGCAESLTMRCSAIENNLL